MTGKMILALVAVSLAGAASGQPAAGPPAASTMADAAARRFPQPVRTGDLVGRKLLAPEESQPVLGRIAGVSRRPDGNFELVVRTGGVFGIGSRLVAVSIDAVGLLGEHVALLGLTPEQLSALPTVPEPVRPLENETIRVGLVKPFH